MRKYYQDVSSLVKAESLSCLQPQVKHSYWSTNSLCGTMPQLGQSTSIMFSSGVSGEVIELGLSPSNIVDGNYKNYTH